MIIFQIIQKPQKRGAEIFAAQLSEKLEKFGHKVILISLFGGTSELPFSGKIIHLNRPISKRFFDIIAWKQISNLVKEYKPDIIQCNAGDTLKYTIFSKIIFRWKCKIITRNASTVSNYIRSISAKTINLFLYKNIDAVISVSKFSASDINQLFPVTKNKTFTIPIGIEEVVIRDVKWKAQRSNSINVIHVGGFTFEKNHHGLLRIWEIFLKSNPYSILHLFGEGPLKSNIEAEVKIKNLQKSVVFYGWVSNPLDYISKADVLVLPSIIEGLPGVLLEAMYCKTPVVAYDVGGIKEIVKNKETGFLIEKNEEKKFSNSILDALNIEKKDIIEKAYLQVKNYYTNEYIAQEFEKTYSNLLNEKN